MMKNFRFLNSNILAVSLFACLLFSINRTIAEEIAPGADKSTVIEKLNPLNNSEDIKENNLEKGPKASKSKNKVVIKSPFLFYTGKFDDNQIYAQSKIPELAEYVSQSTEVVTQKEINLLHPTSLEDILGTVPGVQVIRKGSIGSPTSFLIMGSDRNLITLDGIRLYNSGIGLPLLNSVVADGIQRLEVIEGPQSTLYGSQAQAGVLALYTRTGKGRPKIEFGGGMGNNATFKENFNFEGGNDSFDYYLGLIRVDTTGGAPTYLNESENDDFGNTSVICNLGKRLIKGNAEVRNIFSYSTAEKEDGIQINGFPIFDPDDENYTSFLYNNFSFTHAPTKWYDYIVKFGVMKSIFKDYDNDVIRAFNFTKTDNNRLIFLTQHNLRYKKLNTLTIGYDLEYNDFASIDTHENIINKDITKNDVYVNDVINIKDTLFIRGGARILDFSLYGTYATPNISASLILPTFKLKDSHSKAIFSYGYSLYEPTPYQLFGMDGNPDLIPEQVFGWNFGFEQDFFKDKIHAKVNIFNNKIEELISINPNLRVFTLQNIPNAKTQGVETSLEINPIKGVKLMGNYNYVNARQLNPITLVDDPIETVPNNSWNFIAAYSPKEDYGVYFKGTTSSTRYGIDYRTFEPGRTKGFVDLGLGAVCKLFEVKGFKVVWFGQLNNLLNEKYEQVLGYQHDGFRFLTGIKIKKTF